MDPGIISSKLTRVYWLPAALWTGMVAIVVGYAGGSNLKLPVLGLPVVALPVVFFFLCWVWISPFQHLQILISLVITLDVFLLVVYPNLWQMTTVPVVLYIQLIAITLLLRRRPLRIDQTIVPIIILFLAYIIAFAFSAILNSAPIYISLQAFQGETRYIPLFFALVMIPLSKMEKKRLLKLLLLIAVFEVVVGAHHLIFNGAFSPFGKIVERETAFVEKSQGSVGIIGRGQFVTTLGGHNMFGIFAALLITLIFALERFKALPSHFKGIVRFLKPGLLFGLVMAWSMAAMAAAALGWLRINTLSSESAKHMQASAQTKREVLQQFILRYLFGGLVIGWLLTAFLLQIRPEFLFSAGRIINPIGYVKQAIVHNSDRPALYYYTVPFLLSESPILGFGPAKWSVAAYADPEVAATIRSNLGGRTSLQDSNYIALLGETGLLGLSSFILLITFIGLALHRSWKQAVHRNDRFSMALTGVGETLVLIYLFIGLTNTFWLSKPISLIFWLLWGIALNGSEPNHKEGQVVTYGSTSQQ
jgi:hypothetical protein